MPRRVQGAWSWNESCAYLRRRRRGGVSFGRRGKIFGIVRIGGRETTFVGGGLGTGGVLAQSGLGIGGKGKLSKGSVTLQGYGERRTSGFVGKGHL